MEKGFSKAKIVGFITIILILLLLVFITYKIVLKNKSKNLEASQNVIYKEESINMNIIGDYIEYVSLGDFYDEQGADAFGENGEDLSDEVIISYFRDGNEVANIETNAVTNYLVKYSLDTGGASKTIYKTVIIVDDKAPVIEFPKKTVISIDEASSFNVTKDVVVKDNSGDATFTYDNTLKSEVGDYVITYKAVDGSLNETVKKRIIKVQ